MRHCFAICNTRLQQIMKKREPDLRRTMELEQLRSRLDLANKKNVELKEALAQNETEILELKRRLHDVLTSNVDDSVIPEPVLESFLWTENGRNRKWKLGWKKSWAVCTPTRIFLYDSEQDKTNNAFSLAIDLNKIKTFSYITSYKTSKKWGRDCDFTLCISSDGIAGDDFSKFFRLQNPLKTNFKGHLFKEQVFAAPQDCDACSCSIERDIDKGYECRMCHYKVHGYHFVYTGCNITDCPNGVHELSFLAKDPESRRTWMGRISPGLVLP